MSEPVVRLEHCRQLGYCASGMRAFFDRYGLDWAAFIVGGLPASTIEATGDAMAIAAARVARQEHGGT